MKRLTFLVTILFVLLLSACKESEAVYNFSPRKAGTLFSSDGLILVEYETNTDGKMVDLSIDRLLTIEEMILLNPIIDFEYEIDDFDGDIFTQPLGQCTALSNDLLVPVNIEIGNTRYKYDGTQCRYRTVDSNNNFRAGFAEEYYLTDRIQEPRNTTISIIVYLPDELVKFVEIYQIPHTYELLGVYHLRVNINRQELAMDLVNYYNDTGMYEQLYLKHQENEATINELLGFSDELNILDLSSITEVVPLIEDFDRIYEEEINAIEELQEDIGENFTTEDEEDPEDETNGDEGDQPTE